VFAPLSIPSPPEDWQVLFQIPLGWLNALIPAIPEDQAIQVHAYAICIGLGIIAATLLTNARLTRRGAEPWVLIDIIIFAVPLGLVGARAYHVLTHPGDYFYEGADPWEVVRIWNGGNAIFGSLIGGAVGAWIGCRVSGIRFWTFADALAPGMLLAQALGRFGNYVNHELYGLPTDLPWGLEIPADNAAFPVGLAEGTLFHPTFLYEMIWNVVGIVLLLALERKRYRGGVLGVPGELRLQWGRTWGLYMVWYGLGRIWFESIRIDPSEIILGLRTNVWGAIAFVVIGLAIIIVQGRRHIGAEPSPYRPGREWTPAAVESEETYSDFDDPDDDAATPSEKLATSAAGTSSP